MTSPSIVEFTTYRESIAQALDKINARQTIAQQAAILIKPNLVNASPHPVTTHPDCCAAVIDYIRGFSDVDIMIAEGTGAAGRETPGVFTALGYDAVAGQTGVPLVDLNHAPLVKKTDDQCPVFGEMFLPELAFTCFIISVPVLKAHSLATMTGTLKNMMGFAPPAHYSGRGGTWKKAVFHEQMQQSILDLNQYRTPDLTVLDASIGLSDYHLGGAHCDPPVNKIVAGFDPLAVDRIAADLLGLDWRRIRHLAG
ncbi:MAG: DUF362 domain-containing protein [Thermodesulfobacteriota bacterium]|nr:DUF362 domain-containing protein [Thermodesulfobacteriota bacterium]